MDNLYLKKYLKYKLKYNKIKGGGDEDECNFKRFLKEIDSSITQDIGLSLIIEYYNSMLDCKQSSDYESCIKRIKNSLSVDSYTFINKIIKYYNFMLKCKQQSTYFDCVKDFHKSLALKELGTAAISAYNSVFIETLKLPKNVYLKANKPTYNFDEIELLINLNNINTEHSENIFTPFTRIIFDTYGLTYYLEFKLYTSDLRTYLIKICSELDGNRDKIIELLKSINNSLNEKLTILLDIDYLSCLDIKLANILISYNEDNFDIKEIVLHDFDMIACCTRPKETTSDEAICKKYEDTDKYLLIYYKLILFFQSYNIIKYYLPGRFVMKEVTKSLFQDELKSISIEDLELFFTSFINENNYDIAKLSIGTLSIATLSIKEKMHFFFHHYLLNLIKKSNPDIFREESDSALLERLRGMIPNSLRRTPTEKEYVPLLSKIFKRIFNGELIL